MDALCEIHKLKNHAAEVQNIMLLKYLLTQIYVTASSTLKARKKLFE